MARRQDAPRRRGAGALATTAAPPIFIVHDLACARAALRAARAAGGPIVLRSPPGAIHAHGLGFLIALFDETRRAEPDVPHETVIDCDDDAARAHRSLALGQRQVAFRGHPAAKRRLDSVAGQLGATVLKGGIPRGACRLDDPAKAEARAAEHIAGAPSGSRRRLAKPGGPG